jgi:pyrimidine operon attenuation protein/uracil phosphoribosyltransferase
MIEINGIKYKNKEILMNKDELNRTVRRMANQILEKSRGTKNVGLIGLQTRGVFLAKRISAEIKRIEGENVPTGIIDIALYRDDIDNINTQPEVKETNFPFEITDKKIILIDDVLFTGRSIRAAMECIMDFGRPKSIKLGVLIDRGHRELPIQPDFVGKKRVASLNQTILVELKETDEKDVVRLLEKK